MSLFGPDIKYSVKLEFVPELDIKRLVSVVNIPYLTRPLEQTLQQEIIARRQDGKISLQQIYELLTKLKDEYKITKDQRDKLMSLWQNYFNQHFPAV